MSAKAGYSTPMLHVNEVERSIRFYELLGFTLIDTDRCNPIGWARMHCEGGALMFLRAEEPVYAAAPGMLFCMYSPDLPGLREKLAANGVKVPEIRHPEYMLSGEIQFVDPDGYAVIVSQWGKPEQEAWDKRLKESPVSKNSD